VREWEWEDRRQFGFPLVTVRATNVYGARQQLFKIIPRSVIYVKLGRVIPLHGGGRAVKSYIHVRDVSRGELAILERGEPGGIYHLSPDAGVAVREVVRLICERLGRDFGEATTVVDERPGQDAAYVIDSTRARTELGWLPQIGMEEGLAEVVSWADDYWEETAALPLEYQHKA
jgi:dTDP-glucose 4,6-dehydratase